MPLQLLVGQPRFSADHGWQDVLPHFPDRVEVSIEAVAPGELSGALADGMPADVVVPIMSAVTPEAIHRGRFGLIQQFGVGTERIDIEAATAAGVWVANMPGLNAIPVAEHALALLLALYRRLPEARQGFRPGHWGEPAARSLAGSTACVVGLGSVGIEVAVRLRALGVRVVGVRRRRLPDDGADLVGSDQLVSAVSAADCVVVCASHQPAAPAIVDADVIAHMKLGAVLINIARGPVIDNDAALAAVHAGRLGGLGLDVFPVEPYPGDGPLLDHPCIVATAHTAALTDGYFRQAATRLGHAVGRYLSGVAPTNTLNNLRGAPRITRAADGRDTARAASA